MMLSYKGIVVDNKLDKIRKDLLAKDHSLLIRDWMDQVDDLKASALFDCFSKMPKPVCHHVHLTACASVEYLLYLTYSEKVYYSNKENMFYVSRKGCNKPGYVKVNSLRQYWHKSDDFDKFLTDKILLKPGPEDKEDH